MKLTASNFLIGLSLIGGISHLMLYTNGIWNNVFFITAMGIVIIPLAIKQKIKHKKIYLFRFKKSKPKSKVEKNDLFTNVKGACKVCGKPLAEFGIDFCSQKCNFENYLICQTKTIQKEEEEVVFLNKPNFTYL